MSAGLHYELHGYICGHGCVKPSPFEGWATFAQIFNCRPDGCRFAAARRVVLHANHRDNAVEHQLDGSFLIWDLYDDSLVVHQRHKHGSSLLRPPAPRWQGPSLDGLIMKAMVLYERD